MSSDFEGIVGHSAQIDYLRRILAQKTMAHAYLFSGPAGLGKRTIARAFAASLLGVSTKDLEKHPNYYFVDYPTDEKTGEVKQHVDIDSIREACDRMRLSTFDGGYKILLIDHSDSMTLQAQNALLKTLEEPSGHALIVLIATMPKIMLPTIVSRCVHMRFSPVNTSEIIEALQEKAQGHEELIETFALGRPGIAMDLLQEEKFAEITARIKESEQFLQGSLAERFAFIQKLSKKDNRHAMEDVVKIWRMILHRRLQTSQHGHVFSLAHALLALDEADESIRRNGNVPLSLEYFAINL